ncbi:MAG: hypothetical protein WCK53_04585 [Methanomicrobiales archaeon]
MIHELKGSCNSNYPGEPRYRKGNTKVLIQRIDHYVEALRGLVA